MLSKIKRSLDNSLFQKFIEYLVDEDCGSALKILSLFEEIDDFFDEFSSYIIEHNLPKKHIDFYNEIKKQELHNILSNRISKPYCELEKLYIDASTYLFDLSPFETERRFSSYLSRCERLILSSSLEKSLQKSMTFELIQENKRIECNNPNSFISSQMISSYSLGILFLILSEKRNEPIFGLPLDEKLVLMITDDHCHHNEMVYEDNIHYYISLAEKNIIYEPRDLYLLALLEDRDIDINFITPKSNATIITNWIEHVLSYKSPQKIKKDLSIKYQQLSLNTVNF